MDNLFAMEHQDNINSDAVVVGNITKKLKKVTIQNYRNIEYKEYELDGNSILLEGNNGLGKTNVLEAIFWCLSGNLFNGIAQTESQEVVPFEAEKDIETSVKLEFIDGTFIFERKIVQKWSRDKKTYKGLETQLLVNNAANKNQKTAINSLLKYLGLENVASEFGSIPTLSKLNLFELIYNANSLRILDYKIIRQIIINIVGEVDFKEIIKEQLDKYNPLVEPLRNHGLDLAALKSNTRSKIFDKSNGLEIQVKNLKATIKSYETDGNKITNKDELENAKLEIEKIDKEIQELKKQKNQTTDQTLKDINNKITKLENDVFKRKEELKTKHQEELDKLSKNSKQDELNNKKSSLNDLNDKLLTLKRTIGSKEIELENTKNTLNNKEKRFKTIKGDLAELKKDYNDIENGNLETTGEKYICPSCGVEFDVSETKKHKDNKLNKIIVKRDKLLEEGRGLKEGIQSLEQDVTIKSDKIVELYNDKKQFDKNIKSLESEIEALQQSVKEYNESLPTLDVDNDKKIIEFKEEINKLNAKKSQIAINISNHTNEIQEEITKLENKKLPFNEIINSETTANSYLKNAELKRKELKKVQEDLLLQNELVVLIKELEKDMYETLDKKIENVFGSNVKFKLYKLNVSNGEYDTRMCEIYVRDIENRWVNLKTINTGMFPVRATEIISKIKEHYNIPKSFIFVDETSSLDEKHLEMVKEYGEQILATRVSKSKTINKTIF